MQGAGGLTSSPSCKVYLSTPSSSHRLILFTGRSLIRFQVLPQDVTVVLTLDFPLDLSLELTLDLTLDLTLIANIPLQVVTLKS